MMISNHNQNMDSWKSSNLYDDLQSEDAQKKRVVKFVVSIKTYKDNLGDKYLNDERFYQEAEAHKTELANLRKSKTRVENV